MSVDGNLKTIEVKIHSTYILSILLGYAANPSTDDGQQLDGGA